MVSSGLVSLFVFLECGIDGGVVVTVVVVLRKMECGAMGDWSCGVVYVGKILFRYRSFDYQS